MTSASPHKSELLLPRYAALRGSVALPGSKSIANRAVLLAAMSSGTTSIENLPRADDVDVLLRALPTLGVQVETQIDGARQRAVIESRGAPFENPDQTPCEIYLENAGTAVRPLTAILSAGRGRFRITGNTRMNERPIADLVRALRQLGVEVRGGAAGGTPIDIDAMGLPAPGHAAHAVVSGEVSSQFVSALLLASPLTSSKDPLVITLESEPVSKPYIDLTVRMLAEFGVIVDREGYTSFKTGRQALQTPGTVFVEGDASAATYFLAAGAIPGSGPVTVEGVGSSSPQGDIKFANLLEDMGATVEFHRDRITVRGPAPGNKLKALDIDMNAMPDAALTLAVLALYCEGVTRIRNIANLRVKESERIAGLHHELLKFGATIQEEHDALHISPPAKFPAGPIRIATYDDHRMAMSFAVAGIGTDVLIEDPGCVSKTYINFFEDFFKLCMRDGDGNH